MKKKLRRILYSVISGFIFVGCLAITGCRQNNNVTKYKAEKIMKEALEEKYGKEFVITNIYKTGRANGLPLSNNKYGADVRCEEDNLCFNVFLDLDGSNCRDDYFKYEMEEPVNLFIHELLSEVEDIEIEDSKVIFYAESGKWAKEDDVEDFLKNTETDISLDIICNGASVEEVSQKCYEVYHLLSEHSIKTYLTFEYNGIRKNLSTGNEEKTKEEIIEKCTFFFDK